MSMMPTLLPRLILLGSLLLGGSCALPHGPDMGMAPLNAVSFGFVSGLHRENARTGFHIAAFSAGTSRFGTYASARFDTIAGLDLLADEAEDDGSDDDDLRFDEYQGAFVYNMGVLFRPAHTLGLYLGGGIGNLYDRQIETRDGRETAILRTLYWEGNLQSGVLWTPRPDFGLDFGYETFDDSWHLAFVANW